MSDAFEESLKIKPSCDAWFQELMQLSLEKKGEGQKSQITRPDQLPPDVQADFSSASWKGTKPAFRAPQIGQAQSSGIDSKGVPGAMPESGSPSAGS